jgi:hypothetical protein
MACVRSVKYKMRFNNRETRRFEPSRGLRQGDPLSPYLFLLCAEGLSSLLAHRKEVHGIEGVRVCRDAPSVSHLLFADDSLFLIKADLDNATSLRQVLDQHIVQARDNWLVKRSAVSFLAHVCMLREKWRYALNSI